MKIEFTIEELEGIKAALLERNGNLLAFLRVQPNDEWVKNKLSHSQSAFNKINEAMKK